MNLTQHRQDLADTLSGVPATVMTYVPERFAAPAILIEPAEPYLSVDDDTPFGHWTVSYDLTVAVPAATNKKATADLDTLIGAIAAALKGAYAMTKVEQPFAYIANSVTHLATVITVTDTTDLTTE